MERRIWHRFYDDGVPYEIPLPQATLVTCMGSTVRDFPDVVATEFFGAKLTYRQFADQVNRFAASLSGLGVKAGDRVAIMLPNCPQAILAHYAALTIGAVVVMTTPLSVEREMEHQFKAAGVKVLVGLDHLYPRIARVRKETPVQHLVITGIRDYLPFPLNLLYPLKARRQKLNLDVPYGTTIHPFKGLIG